MTRETFPLYFSYQSFKLIDVNKCTFYCTNVWNEIWIRSCFLNRRAPSWGKATFFFLGNSYYNVCAYHSDIPAKNFSEAALFFIYFSSQISLALSWRLLVRHVRFDVKHSWRFQNTTFKTVPPFFLQSVVPPQCFLILPWKKTEILIMYLHNLIFWFVPTYGC